MYLVDSFLDEQINIGCHRWSLFGQHAYICLYWPFDLIKINASVSIDDPLIVIFTITAVDMHTYATIDNFLLLMILRLICSYLAYLDNFNMIYLYQLSIDLFQSMCFY